VRPSSYTIYVPVESGERFLLVHGYTGAVDVVDASVVRWMMRLEPVKLLEFPTYDATAVAKAEATQRLNGRALPILTRRVASGNNEAIDIMRSFSVESGDDVTMDATTIDALLSRGYLTRKTSVEEEAYLARIASLLYERDKRTGVGFLFIPTYACNLRCPYCFEKTLYKQGQDFQHGIGPDWRGRVMDTAMADHAFAAMREIEPNPERVWYVEFYGGEPLMSHTKPIVEYVLMKGLDQGYHGFRATTNGAELHTFDALLGPELISSLQITIDGPPTVHDARRFLYKKQGTFDRIARNITMALEREVTISVRVNVDRRNAGAIRELSQLFNHYGWTSNPRFSSYLANVILNESKSAATRFESEADMAEHVRAGEPTAPIREIDWGISDNLIASVSSGHPMHLKSHFCGAATGMFLLDPFGHIYTCWELVGEPHARVGEFMPRLEWSETIKTWRKRSVSEIPAFRK
jgi:uncharacterized protein